MNSPVLPLLSEITFYHDTGGSRYNEVEAERKRCRPGSLIDDRGSQNAAGASWISEEPGVVLLAPGDPREERENCVRMQAAVGKRDFPDFYFGLPVSDMEHNVFQVYDPQKLSCR